MPQLPEGSAEDKANALANKGVEEGASAAIGALTGTGKNAVTDYAGKKVAKFVAPVTRVLVKGGFASITLCLVMLLALIVGLFGAGLGGTMMPSPVPEDPQKEIAGQIPGDWFKVLKNAQESTEGTSHPVPWTVLAGMVKVSTDFGRCDPYADLVASPSDPGATPAAPTTKTKTPAFASGPLGTGPAFQLASFSTGDQTLAVTGGYSRESWAKALLGKLALPASDDNVAVLVAWAQQEGGHWNNKAKYNPLNTTWSTDVPGSTTMNSVGVRAYVSWDQGFDATTKTLTTGHNYDKILANLRAKADPVTTAQSIVDSPWGTQHITVSGTTVHKNKNATTDEVVSTGPSCAEPRNGKIGGGKGQGTGPFLLTAAAVDQMRQKHLDPQDPQDSANFVAAALAASADELDGQPGVPVYGPDGQKTLNKFWAMVIDNAAIIMDPTSITTDCAFPGGGDAKVDYKIRWIWRCVLNTSPSLNLVAQANDTAGGAPTFEVLDRSTGQAQAISEALVVSYGFSKWKAKGCDKKAALAGIFPLSAATAKKYGGANRCDTDKNIAAAARAFLAVEKIAPKDRSTAAGPYAPMIGGWSSMPAALGSDYAPVAQYGPAQDWSISDACRALIGQYSTALADAAPTGFTSLAGASSMPDKLPADVTKALTAHPAKTLMADTRCAGAATDEAQLYPSIAEIAASTQPDNSPPPVDLKQPAADQGAALRGVSSYFEAQAPAKIPDATWGTSSFVSRLSVHSVNLPSPPANNLDGAALGTETQSYGQRVVAYAAAYGGFGWDTGEGDGKLPPIPGTEGATGALKPGAVPAKYAQWITDAAATCKGLPVGVFAAQLKQESGFNPTITSPVGATGIGQFMPSTWASEGVDANHDGKAIITDPMDNIFTAAKYDCELLHQVRKYPGDPLALMLASYNAGFGAVQKYQGLPPYKETQNYVKVILANAKDMTVEVTIAAGGGTAPGQLIWPLPKGAGYKSGDVGPRHNPVTGGLSCHSGTDIAAPSGTPIYAAADGVVIDEHFDRWDGEETIVDHGGGLKTLSAHQSRRAVPVGAHVKAGQVIGYVGSTGNSTGPHLHFDVIVNGTLMDPMGWFGGPKRTVQSLCAPPYPKPYA